MSGEHLVDEGLVTDPSPSGVTLERPQHGGIDPDGNELAGLGSERGPPDPPQGAQLLR